MASERAGGRVLESVSAFVSRRLKLKVNLDKSGVYPASRGALLGFGFFKRDGKIKVRIDPMAKKAAKKRIKEITARSWGISMGKRIHALNRFISGWCAYFGFAQTPSVFAEFDEWLRRRLRQVHWKQWKRGRTRAGKLQSLGIPRGQARQWAYTRKGSWRIAGSAVLSRALPNAYWASLGLRGFERSYGHVREVWRTAGCGPACPVV
ncbi:MAG: group II intron maturase-specific domain-containing protein [Actinomycetota bacterium]